MCGIAGILQHEPLHSGEELESWTRAMARAMSHRGPDDEGVWVSPDARCALSHRRLSIIDLSSAGHQPMPSADGRRVISFNGEIYNHRELAAELENRGVRFRGHSDTEVLLEAIRIWGADALLRLDGMYAFGCYDLEERGLWLARDPFGEKPLYYCSDGRRLAFASELHALQVLPFFDDVISEESVAEYLCLQYVDAPRSLYQSVSKLPPGHLLRVDAGGRIGVQRFYEFRPGGDATRGRSLDDLADELEEILVRSLERRLVSDVPLGAFLSGGVDSSTVCALVRSKLDVPLQTFSAGFTGTDETEHEQARRFAAHLGTEHHETLLTPDATEFLLQASQVFDEPNGDTSCLPTYLLSAFARERVTVAVSGDGGDEMFGGYNRYFDTLSKRARAQRRGRSHRAGWDYYSERILTHSDPLLRELFGQLPGALADHLDGLRFEIDRERGRGDLLQRMRKSDVEHYMPGAVLAKVDRMSMQHALEVRTPFLSIELARFAEGLHSGALVDEAEKRGKLVLRRVAERYLPREWLDQPKRGFGLPMGEGWAREHLLELVGSLLESDSSVVVQLAGRAGANRYLDRQRSPEGFNLYQLWAVAVLELYLQKRPARLTPREARPTLDRVALSSDPPESRRLIERVEREARPVVLFCRDHVPAGWQRLRGRLTVAAPFEFEGTDGVTRVDVDWPEGGKRAIRSLAGRVPQGAIAAFPELTSATAATPELCAALAEVGFADLALATRDRLGTSLIDLQRLHDADRKISRRRLWRGRRLTRFRAGGGYLFRAHRPGGRKPLTAEQAQRYAVFEDGRPLLHAEAAPDATRDCGGGRFRLTRKRIYLSSSDFSDPRTSRHRYRLVDLKRKGLEPWWRPDDGCAEREPYLDALNRRFRSDPGGSCPGPRAGDTIALVTSSLQQGGAERQWVYLARELASRDLRVVLLVFDLDGEHAHYLPLLEGSPVEVVESWTPGRIPAGPGVRELDDEAFELASFCPADVRWELPWVSWYLANLGVDYVACQLDGSNLVGGIGGLLAGAQRALVSFRNVNPTHFSYLRNDWYVQYYRALAASPRVAFTGNSSFGNADYADWMGIDHARVRTIHNGFSPADLPGSPALGAALRAELGIPASAPVAGALFRISEEKDPDTFGEAAAHALTSHPRLHLVHAGRGDTKPLRARFERAGVADRVHLLGRREDPGAVLAASDLLLHASLHEGISNTMLEAQYAQVPIVATATGGTRETVVDGETALLAPMGDAPALAAHIRTLLDDLERRRQMGDAGRRRVETEFSLERLVDATLEALSQP